jgi:hypothetical protein
VADLKGLSYLVAKPACLGRCDALSDGDAGEKGNDEESGGEAEQGHAILPQHQLHRLRAWEPAGSRSREDV